MTGAILGYPTRFLLTWRRMMRYTSSMTKTEILGAAQQDSDATAKLVEALQASDTDGMLNLIERLIAATRKDTADDILVDLKREGMNDAAQLVRNEYL